MKIARKIELLAPAKNLECGMEAINHGADAVYIGSPQFSARAAAGNSIDDIRKLAEYAHTYFAKVYVALNTIISDHEITAVEQMIRDIYHAGADALIIQDMGILNLDLPPIPLHASTQCDNRSIEKVQFLQDTGFSQVVLARELSIRQIREIAENTQVPLEAFVHGALCVCYSGQCYISQALSGRSANRGECAQYCRMPYTLQDSSGKALFTNKHLLSMKDLNLSEHLEELLDAGVSSLKIEGRLKDVTYVKNITAHYRKCLDEVFSRRPEYLPASSGKSVFYFVPDPKKSFNRGFTNYFAKGRDKNMASPDTPKSLGEAVGNVKDLSDHYFTWSGQKPIHNGDGLCFLNEKKELSGFRVNKVEGNRVFPAEMPRLTRGITLYRNYDHEFEKNLQKKSAERKIRINCLLEENNFGFSLTITDEDDRSACAVIAFEKELSKKNQEENIRTQLSKLGNTIFELEELTIRLSDNWFIPSSILSDLRRKAIDSLLSVRKITFPVSRSKVSPSSHTYTENSLDHRGNVFNEKAREFYKKHGVDTVDPAFESLSRDNVPLMQMRYCLRYQLGCCLKDPKATEIPDGQLTLLTGNHQLKLNFNCEQCEMTLGLVF